MATGKQIIDKYRNAERVLMADLVLGAEQGMLEYRGHIMANQMSGRPGLKAPTGNLRRSWRVAVKNMTNINATITLGTGVKYARIHQTGGTIRHPGGTPYIVTERGAIFMKKDGTYPASTQFTKPHDITIPKRLHVEEDFQTVGIRMIKNRIKGRIKAALKAGG